MSDNIPEIPDTTDPRVGTSFRQGRWQVTVSTDDDYDSSPEDGDWATDAQVSAWMNSEWGYSILTVNVSDRATGVELGSASLGGIESGYFTYTDESDNVTGKGYVGPSTEAVDDCIAEATEAADVLLKLLRQEDDRDASL